MSDSLYHRLFIHPQMTAQLVRDFIPEAAALELDFSRMELVSPKYRARRGARREGDLVWRLPMGDGGAVYLYLMLEFQSRSDWWMALRVHTYVGLLWKQIIAEKRLRPGSRLPPILPIVLYNGDRPWSAPQELAPLVDLPPASPLWFWTPRLRYYLLDEGALRQHAAERRESLVALLFRLEHCADADELVRLAGEVVSWFRAHPDYDPLKDMMRELIFAAASNLSDPTAPPPLPDDLQEIHAMLATRSKLWAEKLLADGRAEGKAEGKAELMITLLTQRFGPLSADQDQFVRAADAPLLDRWTQALFTAPTLDTLLHGPKPH